MIEAHPMHERSFPWLKRAKAKKIEWAVCSQTLAELYATLTSMPLRPRITPEIAVRLLNEKIEKEAQVISLTSRDYLEAINFQSSGPFPLQLKRNLSQNQFKCNIESTAPIMEGLNG
jgi:predicted nucleic acid-binding protein